MRLFLCVPPLVYKRAPKAIQLSYFLYATPDAPLTSSSACVYVRSLPPEVLQPGPDLAVDVPKPGVLNDAAVSIEMSKTGLSSR